MTALTRRGRAADQERRLRQLQAVAATADLSRHMPGWRSSPEQLRAMNEGEGVYTGALHTLGAGWTSDDARWDLLTAVIEYNRRHPQPPPKRPARQGPPWYVRYEPEVMAGSWLLGAVARTIVERRRARAARA